MTQLANTAHTQPAPLLEVRNLHRHYQQPRQSLLAAPRTICALNGINLTLHAGQSLGIVGESGSGKSTLARLIMALDAPSSGSVWFKGQNLHTLPPKALQAARRDFQMVFQDPYGSLDPRQRISRIVTEPLHNAGLDAATLHQRAIQALAEIGLPAEALERYPHQFSGGQRQRIAIARACISRPQLIVADEPVSALDASVQAQVLKLLQTLQTSLHLSLILISHDLAIVQHLCHQVAVLHQGRIVEYGNTAQVLQQPQHPYTQALLAAAL